MDSGANTHVYNDPKWLLNPIDLIDVEVHARLADGKKVRIESFGDVYSNSIKAALQLGESLV